MTNFRPTLQGVMMRRPPLIHVDPFEDHALKGELFPFTYSIDASYLILATEDGFKFYANDGLITTASVSATIAAAGASAFTDQADGATITASSTGAGAVADLVDEDGSTVWSSSTAGTEYLNFDMGSAVTLRSIWLTASVANEAPTAFTIKASSTGAFAGEEVTVLTVTGQTWAVSERKKYRFTAPASKRYYRLTITANGGGSAHTLAEVSLFNSDYMDRSATPSSVSLVGSNLVIDGDGGNSAVLELPIAISNLNTRHVIAFEITHGPLDFRIGSTAGDDDVVIYEGLREGVHRLAFLPTTSTVYLQFRHTADAGRWVKNDISILPGPDFTLPCPFLEDDLPEVHVQQIRDVLYMVHKDYWPRRLERRGDRSWSITKLIPTDGPMGDLNTTETTLTPSDTTGEITLTASADLFDSNDVGALYHLTSGGTTKIKVATASGVYTDSVKVAGGPSTRTFTVTITGTFVGTVKVQKSSGNENSFIDDTVAGPWTAPVNVVVDDNRQNETLYYRLKVTAYTSGTITMKIFSAHLSSTGVVQVLEYSSPTSVIAEVLDDLASTDATKSWKRGDWNLEDGFPAAVSDGFGRLWFGRGAEVWASKSDDFTSFKSVTEEADSSFSRNLATPSSDAVRWLAMLNHLIIGTASLEKVGLGNTNSEAIGPTNFQFLPGSEEGGAAVQPIEAGGSVIYVSRSKRRLMQFTQNPKALSETSYISVDLTARAPEILNAKIVDVAVQREPERRIYVVLESGRLCELLFRREGELDVVAWSIVETQGRVERVTVLPREDEDIVYFIVRRRNADGDWERFIERLGPERVLMDCDRYHLDSCLGYELVKPATTATPSDTTGSITVEVDDDTFIGGDVGKVLWINGGRGTITARTDGYTVTMTVTSELDSTDPAPSQRWGLRATTTTLSGLTHLEGQTVRIWGDMTDLGTATVAAGSITLPQAVSVAYAGLAHTSRWKSLKLAYGAQKGTAIGMKKAVKRIILLLYKTGAALQFSKGMGPGLKRSFQKLRDVPTRTPDVPYGEPIPLFTGEKDHAFDAHYDEDARICFQIEGPAPAIIAGYVPVLDEKDK